MKKTTIILLAALLTLAACTKTEKRSDKSGISFNPAALMTRAGIDGPEFPTSETFGVYAWTPLADDGVFMPNERVSYNPTDGTWKASGTYYWPNKVVIDFFGYYPYGMSELTATPDVITYTDYDVEAAQQDAMYSSKAAGYGYNPDGTYAGIDGSKGVPIIFHHALGKVQVDARAAYDHIVEPDGSVYDWTVTLNSITISDFYKKGGAVFTIEDEPKEGIVEWTKPADEDGNHVWTNDGAKTLIFNEPKVLLPTGKNDEGEYNYVNVLPEFFVLPQAVTEPERDERGWPIPGQQIHRVTIDVTIVTKLNGEELIRESHSIRTAYLYMDEIPAWQINYRTIYRLVVYPLGPGYGPDTDRPVITFDPAVADWEYLTATTTIVL